MDLKNIAAIQLELLGSLELEVTDPLDLIDLGKTLIESYKKAISTIYSGHEYDKAWITIATVSYDSLETLCKEISHQLTSGYIVGLPSSVKIKYIKLLSSLQELPTYESRLKQSKSKSAKPNELDEIDFSQYKEFLDGYSD